MLVAPVWGGRLLIPANDLILMPELVVAGTYDVPFTAFVREHVQPGDVAIDVGAHVGLFTLLLAYEVWERGHVIAYEANPNTLPVLRDNIAMNYLDDRVEIVGRAAGARAGHAQLVAPERFRAMSSIQPLDEDTLLSGSKVDRVERFDVEVEPLDTHVGRFERIDVVKIDVEGAEEQVFAGMANLLESRVVRRVCFEMIRPQLGADWERLRPPLEGLRGQGVAVRDAAGLRHSRAGRARPSPGARMVVAGRHARPGDLSGRAGVREIELFDGSAGRMSLGERAAFEGLLGQLSPGVALQIGLAEEANAKRLAAHAGHVLALDVLEPARLESLAAEGEIDFVLVDGERSAEAIRRTLEQLLDSPALASTVILVAEAGHPDVRAGADAVPYTAWPKVARCGPRLGARPRRPRVRGRARAVGRARVSWSSTPRAWRPSRATTSCTIAPTRPRPGAGSPTHRGPGPGPPCRRARA